MPARFYRPPKPPVPRAKVPDLVLMILGVPLGLASLLVALRLPGFSLPPHVLVVIPVYALHAADLALTIRATKFADELYEFINDVGDQVSSGFGVEQAIHITCERRGGLVADEFRRALRYAEDRPLDIALIDAATEFGDATFSEVAELLSMMVQSDGEVGLAIKSLGKRLTRTRKAERENEGALGGGLALLLFFGGFIAPAMAAFMFAALNRLTEADYPLHDWSYRFYALVALTNGLVQFTVFGSVRRTLARVPSYVMTTYLCLVALQYLMGNMTWDEIGFF